MSEVWAVVLAGGERHSATGAPKQFLPLGGRPLIDWVLAAAATVTRNIVAVLPAGVPWDLPVGVRRVDGGANSARFGSLRARRPRWPGG